MPKTAISYLRTISQRIFQKGLLIANNQISEIPIDELAENYKSKVIKAKEELEVIGENFKGLLLGVIDELYYVPHSAITLAPTYIANHIKYRILNKLNMVNPDAAEVVLIPGYFAINEHLSPIQRHLEGRGKVVKTHPSFDTLHDNRDVIEDAHKIADMIRENHESRLQKKSQLNKNFTSTPKTNIIAHSRGGLVSLCALKVLEDSNESHLIESVVLMSPISHGVRSEIRPVMELRRLEILNKVANLIPLKKAKTFLKELIDSEMPKFTEDGKAVKFWQTLSDEARKKVTVVSQEGGDAFTSPKQSFVDGGTMLLTPHCGHQSSVRNPNKNYFKLVIDLIDKSDRIAK